MLFNPEWEVETKPDVLSLENLVAWLETKDPAEHYNFHESNKCVLAQWAESIDPCVDFVIGETSFDYLVNGQMVSLRGFKAIANDGNCKWTFGAALTRARAALAHK